MLKINYNNLQDMDYVFTTSLSVIACRIRITEAGWKNVFNTKIGTHEGRIIMLEAGGTKVAMIAEMDPLGSRKQAGSLKIHPLSSYVGNGWRGSRIVSIKRSPVYDDAGIRDKAVDGIMAMWKSGKLKYDPRGAASHAKLWSWLGESKNPNAYYCSEFSEFVDQHFAGFSTVGKLGKTDNIHPYQHQLSKQTKEVDWKIA